MTDKKRGFAKFPEDKHLEAARKGGSRKVPTKGFGSLSKKERSEISRRAAKARWENPKEEESNGKTEHSTKNQPE